MQSDASESLVGRGIRPEGTVNDAYAEDFLPGLKTGEITAICGHLNVEVAPYFATVIHKCPQRQKDKANSIFQLFTLSLSVICVPQQVIVS